MPRGKVQCAFEGLTQLANNFSQEAGQTEATIGKIQSLVDQLESGGWEGNGARAFYAEMNDMFPKLKKLVDALETANNQLKAVSSLFSNAESDMAGAFKSNMPKLFNFTR